MLAVALVTASSAAINNVRPLLDPLSLIGDAKATQRCGVATMRAGKSVVLSTAVTRRATTGRFRPSN